VYIGTDAIRIDSLVLLPLAADRARGADAVYKRNGENDLFLVPLADALARARAEARLQRQLVVVVARDASYRVLMEVLYTAGQNELSRYELHEDALVGRVIVTEPPSAGRPQHLAQSSDELPRGPRTLGLVVVVVDGGLQLKGSGGSIAPGCNGVGPGPTIPRVGGKLDLGALVACARKLRAAHPDHAQEKLFTFAAARETPFHEVVDVVLAMRGTSSEPLFSDVHFGITR